MFVSKPIAVVSAGCRDAIRRGRSGPERWRARPRANPAVQALVLDEPARIDWIEKSERGRLAGGCHRKDGAPDRHAGQEGRHDRQLAQEDRRADRRESEPCRPRASAPAEKAEAQKEVAISVVARNKRLEERKPGMVSAEEIAKAEGELEVAEAQLHEAKENQEIAKAELDLAQQTLDEHTILRTVRWDHHQANEESRREVRASDAVVQLGNLSRLYAQGLCAARICLSGQGRSGRRDPASDHRIAQGESPCPSRKSGSGARSRSSILRSSRWPKRRCGSAPSSRIPTSSCVRAWRFR